MKNWKKFLSLLLAIVMMLQLFPTIPTIAWAEDGESTAEMTMDEAEKLGLVHDFIATPEKSEYTAEDVLFELTDLRGESVKQFHMADGNTLAVSYSFPVHTLDQEGCYQDIDNRLALYNVDGTLSEQEPDALLNAWLEEQAALKDQENDSAKGQPEEAPPEETPAVEDPSEEAPEPEQPEQPEPTPEEDPDMGDAGEEQAIPEDEEAADASEEASEQEQPDTEPSDENEESEDTPVEDTPEEPTEEPRANDHGLGDIPDDLPAPVPGPNDPRYYRNGNGIFDVCFSVLSNAEKLVRLSFGQYTVSMSPVVLVPAGNRGEIIGPAVGRIDPETRDAWDEDSLDYAITPHNTVSSLTYQGVFDQADLQYILAETSLKENIVIQARADSYVYTFLLDTGDLTPVLTEAGDVELQDGTGVCVMFIPAGYMYDSAGEVSNSVRYELWKRGSTTYLSVIADSAWINAEDRQFPVIVDPSVTVKGDSSIEISTVCSGSPDSNNNSIPYPSALTPHIQKTGLIGYYPNQNIKVLRTLVHIRELPELPANSTVIHSKLHFYVPVRTMNNLNSMLIEARALTTNEEQDGAWCTYHTWNDCENMLSSSVLDFCALREAASADFNITREAVRWYNDPSTNYGICIKPINETSLSNGSYGWGVFQTTYYSAPYHLHRTSFTVTYRSTSGVEDYFSYQTQNIGRAGTAYVGDYSGQLTLVKGDVSSASTSNPVSVGHVYNSAFASGEYGEAIPDCTGLYPNMKFGAGWKLDLQQSITRCDDNTLMYVDGDGTIHYFIKNSDGKYYDEDGLNLTVTVSGSNFTCKDAKANILYFAGGLLSYIKDSNGNQINIISSNGQITSVQRQNKNGTAETVATFSYDADNYLTGITNSASKTTTFTYDSAAETGRKLVSISHPDGTSASYGYDANGRLNCVTDNETGYSVSYEYHANTGKITQFSERAGNVTGAEVSVDGTRHGMQVYRSCGPDMHLGNNDDLLTTCVFDYWGRTVNTYTTSVDMQVVYGASAGSFSENSGTSSKNNRILTSSSTGIQNPNMLADPSLEKVTDLSSAGTWYATDLTGNPSNAASVETTKVRTGVKSAKLTDSGIIGQTVTGLTPAGWYVVSAYVNTREVTAFAADGGVYMANGTTRGEALRWKTGDVGDGWERIYLATQADSNGELTLQACASGFTGAVYFDDLQMEVTPFGTLGTPSAASILNNGAMERSDSWSVWVTGCHQVAADGGLHGKGLAIDGIPGECIDVFQEVKVNQPSSQTYLFSAWGKADSVPVEAPPTLDRRYYSLCVQIFYSDKPNEPEFHRMDFNQQSTEWQYLVFPIVPKRKNKTVTKLRVMSTFGRNPNHCVFDDLTLTREDAQSFTYDSNGNLTSVAQPGNATPTFSYTGADLVTQVTKGSGTCTYTYDGKHNVTSVKNDNLKMTVTYDAKGNATGTTLKKPNANPKITTSATYDAEGNLLLSQTDQRGNTINYAYDGAMNRMLGSPSEVTDPLGNVSTTTYDENNGRVTNTAILDESSQDDASLAYTYSGGNLTAMTRTAKLPGGASFTQSYGMSYNGFGQTTGISVGSIPLANYSYAPNGGALQSMSYGNGDSVNYTYDALERIKSIYYNDDNNPALTYGYAANGALGNLTDHVNNRRYVYNYDGLDRLISMTEIYDGDAVQLYHMYYDTANRAVGTEYKVSPAWDGELGDTRSYGYAYSDTNGTMTSMTLPGNGAYSYVYDNLRRIKSRSLTLNSNAFLTRVYSYLGGAGDNTTTTLVGSLENKKGSTQLNAWQYTYDANGNITSISDGTNVWTYTYDRQGQLLTETMGTGVNAQTWTYTYDTAGNLRSRSDGTTTDTYTYGSANWADLLTAYNGNPITYDDIGNPTTWYDGAAMTWANGRRLESISATTDHAALSFTYDNSGLRLTKTVGTVQHRYTWQGSKLIAESYGNTELEFFYDESGAPYALLVRNIGDTSSTETWYYYVTNLQGDVVMLLDASGNTVAKYSYNAWGQILNVTNDTNENIGDLNPIRYRGYYYDAETGLYYLQSRYYDPALCRFLNADGLTSTGQGVLGCNMFAYCNNNPIIAIDPTGQKLWYQDADGNDHEAERRFYHSADAAAIAFSEEIYGLSSYVLLEFSTEIYYVRANGTTRYYYTSPAVGTAHSSSGIDPNHVPTFGEQVAYAHTHPNSNQFSAADKNYSQTHAINAYVIGPNLVVQKYDITSDETIKVGTANPTLFVSLSPDRLCFYRLIWENHFVDGECPKDFGCENKAWPNN